MKKYYYSQGLSLVELVVVLALFMVLIGTAVTIFVSVVQRQKDILSQGELLNQVSYVQDYVSRALRGAVVDVSGSCLVDQQVSYPGFIYLATHYNTQTATYQGITFINKDNICQEFFFDVADGTLKEVKDGANAQNILSSKFQITGTTFVLNGNASLQTAGGSDGTQSRITMGLNMPQTASRQAQVFQTTVSQRNIVNQ